MLKYGKRKRFVNFENQVMTHDISHVKRMRKNLNQHFTRTAQNRETKKTSRKTNQTNYIFSLGLYKIEDDGNNFDGGGMKVVFALWWISMVMSGLVCC